jgi:hypothetical protein
MSLKYDRTGGGTQECFIQYPQCRHSVGCRRGKWGVGLHDEGLIQLEQDSVGGLSNFQSTVAYSKSSEF